MRAHGLVMALWIAAPAVASADCIHSAFEQELDQLLDEAEAEYPHGGEGRFMAVSQQLLTELACMDELVSSQFSARVHRVLGLRARVAEGSDDIARMSFAASRRIDPTYTWPADVIGPEEPERILYLSVPPGMVVFEEAPRPREGTVFFDGEETLSRPSNVPTLYQRFDGQMRIIETAWLSPGQSLPGYAMKREVVEPEQERGGASPLRTVGTVLSSSLVGAGTAMVFIGSWDKGRVCLGLDSEGCQLAARERVLLGSALVGVGVGGLAGSQLLVGAAPGRPTVGLRGVW